LPFSPGQSQFITRIVQRNVHFWYGRLAGRPNKGKIKAIFTGFIPGGTVFAHKAKPKGLSHFLKILIGGGNAGEDTQSAPQVRGAGQGAVTWL
jgi:hypothetical protein